MRLTRSFFDRAPQEVAPDLLGKLLVRVADGRRLSGIVVETEAYCGADQPDMACHGDRANKGRPTPRTAVMFGPPAFAYVYFTYGMHWMLNAVTGADGRAGAVLIRALQPVDGLETMVELRNGRAGRQIANGPAKLTQALAINKSQNGIDMCGVDTAVWFEDASPIPPDQISVGPRIGLGKTPEPAFSQPWRYWIAQNSFVSK